MGYCKKINKLIKKAEKEMATKYYMIITGDLVKIDETYRLTIEDHPYPFPVFTSESWEGAYKQFFDYIASTPTLSSMMSRMRTDECKVPMVITDEVMGNIYTGYDSMDEVYKFRYACYKLAVIEGINMGIKKAKEYLESNNAKE